MRGTIHRRPQQIFQSAGKLDNGEDQRLCKRKPNDKYLQGRRL